MLKLISKWMIGVLLSQWLFFPMAMAASGPFTAYQTLTANALNNALASPNITGGTIDGVVIGGIYPVTIYGTLGNFWTINVTNLNVASAVSFNSISTTSVAASSVAASSVAASSVAASSVAASSVAIGGSATGNIGTSGLTGKLVVDIDTGNPLAVEGALRRSDSTASLGASFYCGKQRGTLSSPSAVVNGDTLCNKYGYGFDGTNYQYSSLIKTTVGGVASSGIVPGMMSLQTANASGVLTEAININASQVVNIPGSLTVGSFNVAPATIASQVPQLGQVPQLLQLQATVSGNALTVTLPPTTLQFKNATINGAPILVNTSAISAVTPTSGATLGSISGVVATYAVVAQYNAGSPTLCIINVGGGTNLDESGMLASTTLSGSSTSASTCYATTGVGATPYRVVGSFTATEATAGTWATAPSVVTGIGGQSGLSIGGMQNLTALSGLTTGTTYYSPSKPSIVMTAWALANAGALLYMTITPAGGSPIVQDGSQGPAGYISFVGSFIPANASYIFSITSGSATFQSGTKGQ